MGRKPDDLNELLARAKANGYGRGEHREKDAVPDRHAHIDKTIYDQDQVWVGRFLGLVETVSVEKLGEILPVYSYAGFTGVTCVQAEKKL
jgi:hypothetical protein